MIYLSYFASALVLLAVYYISKPKLRGQYFIVIADVTWFIYSLSTKQYALALQSMVLLIIGMTAIYNWRKKNISF